MLDLTLSIRFLWCQVKMPGLLDMEGLMALVSGCTGAGKGLGNDDNANFIMIAMLSSDSKTISK